ncbi:MAG: hypothetical protein US60_C0008G0042 [Microgenomates group bacterium GW2011_GWC1_37_8]|uniref:Uncharacterized protein n=1 Tax=Candidatus Woesebacteria bacterium GW2011_GWB1_38_8 TaxID=1618570 RepID=A0A0G0L4D2_9BACT|nr:MAG: hypothetical protein US60_C0008G0042 [Microgenomates group bacterium GW2011_GWC1_37_8]KKQ85877.1 MAG: hypothetical protein UT08_C0003G0040 [Candidatus Woesebacteria bacterium GW2011_GWB1_38_8]
MSEENETRLTPQAIEQEAGMDLWLSIIQKESLLPVVNPDVLQDTIRICQERRVSPKLVMTLCPVFENIAEPKGDGPTRRILHFSPEIPRLQNFVREVASLTVVTETSLGVKPQVLLLINDIFEPGAEKRIENIESIQEFTAGAKATLHKMFQELDSRNPSIWPHKIQRLIKILAQSDFVKPLSRFDLPTHPKMVKTIMNESLDPEKDAFRTWLWFLENTRKDPLMTPKAWLKESGARIIHERVRFLAAMYWTDGIVVPILWNTLFPSQNPVERNIQPIFICGVTRNLQAEMEMAGPNLKMQDSSLNGFGRVAKVRQPTSAIHIFKNTAMWTEDAQEPFSFGGRVNLL